MYNVKKRHFIASLEESKHTFFYEAVFETGLILDTYFCVLARNALFNFFSTFTLQNL